MRQTRTVFRFSRYLRSAGAALCAGALAGCASTAPPSPEAALVERAAQYLAARQAGDVDTAYSLLAPSLRAVTGKEQFAKLHGEKEYMQGGDLYSVTCEEGRCVLRRIFSYVNMSPFMRSRGGQESMLTMPGNESWVREEGQWWVFMQ